MENIATRACRAVASTLDCLEILDQEEEGLHGSAMGTGQSEEQEL